MKRNDRNDRKASRTWLDSKPRLISMRPSTLTDPATEWSSCCGRDILLITELLWSVQAEIHYSVVMDGLQQTGINISVLLRITDSFNLFEYQSLVLEGEYLRTQALARTRERPNDCTHAHVRTP